VAEPLIEKQFAVLLLAELQDLRHQIAQIGRNAATGGAKQWLKPSEFAKLSGLAPRTLAVYAAEGRLSDRAVRRIKRGSRFMNEFHRTIALDELQNLKTVLRR
jgi:DNA-binding transcriptional MerR regulator